VALIGATVLVAGIWTGATSPDRASSIEQTTLHAPSRRLSADSKAYRTARDSLPPGFMDYSTRRFVLISNADARWTREQGELLEKTHHQFHRYTKRLGLKPKPLRHKLVCVLFADRDDYRRFAAAHDDVTADWISGYYSPQHDRIVFYNLETEDGGFADAGLDVPKDHWAWPEVQAARQRFADERAKAATATTIHEAVHQLAFHTSIQTAHIQNPIWISEGLATSFETDKPKGSFGPDHDYSVRREQFQELVENDTLIPLRQLVTHSEMPDNRDETITAVYHQSYALVAWLSRFRREELRDYLVALRGENPGRPTKARHLELFEEHFGDVNLLEEKWLKWERRQL
jgi:hypothetical protein